MTMNDYSDKHPALPSSSQPQQQQPPEATANTLSLSGLDIPTSDLDLDYIIAPSKPNPEQWAEPFSVLNARE